jgi:hypothetical protein
LQAYEEFRVPLQCYIIAEDKKTAKEMFDSEKPLRTYLYDESLFVRDAQGFTDTLLQPLCGLLAPGSKMQIVERSADGKKVLLHFPDKAVEKFAALQNNQMKSLADQWLKAMPPAYQTRLKIKDVENGLRFLSKIMVDAKALNKPVFLYESL